MPSSSQPAKPAPLWWNVFVAEYLKNGQNALRAYMKAKPNVKEKTASVEAGRLLAKPCFQAFLAEKQQRAEKKIEMSKDEWLRLIADCARFDVRQYLQTESGSGDVQLVEDWQKIPDGHALESIELSTTTLESGAVVQRVKLKAAAKMRALEILGKALGYVESEVHVHVGEDINPELRQRLIELRAAIAKREQK